VTFYRRPRVGERRSSAGAGEVNSPGINVAQRRRRDLTAGGGGGYWQGRGQAAGTGQCRTSLCGEGMARGRRCIVREEDDAADRWGRSASERERARERGWQVGLACQREKEGSVRAAVRAGVGRLLGRREDTRARGRGEAAATWVRFGPAGGKELFLFIFYNSFPFLFLFFLNKSFSR
jgi:hypothetical protein